MKTFYTTLLLILLYSTSLQADWKRVYRHYENKGMQQYDLSCADSLNCISLASPGGTGTMLIRTTDGGFNWYVQYADTAKNIYNDKGQWVDTEMPKFPPPRCLEFVNSNFIVVGHKEGVISISRDGGNTFEGIRLDTSFSIKEIKFFDSFYGIVNQYQKLFKTTDGGANWEEIGKNIDTISKISFESVFLINDIIYVSGYHINPDYKEVVYKSTDKGSTWQIFYIHYPTGRPGLKCIHFINETEGWISARRKADSGSAYAGVIFHTSDGGVNWEIQLDTLLKDRPAGLYGIYFANGNEGLAYGDLGVVWRTTEGGNGWLRDQTFPIDQSDNFTKLVFPKGDTKRILANVWMYGEIWLYDENLSFAEQKVSNLNVSPNPASDFISLTGLTPGERIEIYSQLGVKVLETNAYEEKLDISALPAGVYFLKAGGKAGKFIKI